MNRLFSHRACLAVGALGLAFGTSTARGQSAFGPGVLEWDGAVQLGNEVNYGPGTWDTVAANTAWRPNTGDYLTLQPPAPPNLNVTWIGGPGSTAAIGGFSPVTVFNFGAGVTTDTLVFHSDAIATLTDPTLGLETITVTTGNVYEDGLATVEVVLGGGAGFTRYGNAGVLTLTYANTIAGAGVYQLGTTTLQNDSFGSGIQAGTLLGLGSHVIYQGATLTLDNSVGALTPGELDRIADGAPVSLFGGTFNMYGRPGFISTETIGVLTVGLGSNTLSMTTSGGAFDTTTLTTPALVRVLGSGATLNVTWAGAVPLGGGFGAPNVVMTGAAPALSFPAGFPAAGILPWATVTPGVGIAPFTFATHGGVGTSLAPYAYLAVETDPPAPWAALPVPSNVLLTPAWAAAPVGVAAVNTINSLNISAPIFVPLGAVPGAVLKLHSGGLIMAPGSGIIPAAPGVTLTAGSVPPAGPAAPGELIVHTPFFGPAAAIMVPIMNNANPGLLATVSLVKTGPGDLILAGPGNGYTGGTWINEGNLIISADAHLGAAGTPVTIAGGYLGIGATFANSGRPFVLGGKSPYSLGNNATGGGIRIADGATYTIGGGTLAGGVNGRVTLTTTMTAPASPLGNGIIFLGAAQGGLTADDTVILNDIRATSASLAAPLGGARIVIGGGSRATDSFTGGDTNDVTRLEYIAAGIKTLANPITIGPLGSHFYVVGLAGDTITVTGDIMRPAYDILSSPGSFATANNTKLILDKAAPGAYFGAAGVAASSGEIEVRTSNSWGGMLDRRELDYLGQVSGARSQPDREAFLANPRRHTVWFRAAPVGDGTYYYSLLNSESQVYNTIGSLYGTKVPLTVEVDAGANAVFTGTTTNGRTLEAMDDIIKTGGGDLTLVFSGLSGGASASTIGHNSVFDVQGGRLILIDKQDASAAYQSFTAPVFQTISPFVDDVLFDGGLDYPQGIGTDGVIDYTLRDTTSLVALFGENAAGNPHTLHFDLSLNPLTPLGSVTIQVGDTIAGGQARQAMIVGSAPFHAVKPVPTMFWTGTLNKTGLGELILDTRIYTLDPSAVLNILQGTVTYNNMTPGASLSAANLSASTTLNGSGAASSNAATPISMANNSTINAAAASAFTINGGVTITGANGNFTTGAGGTLTTNGTIAKGANNANFSAGAGGTININGSITGAGDAYFYGPGTVEVNSLSGYGTAGVTTSHVSGGIVNVNPGASLGIGDVEVTGGTLNLRGAGNVTGTADITVTSPGILNFQNAAAHDVGKILGGTGATNIDPDTTVLATQIQQAGLTISGSGGNPNAKLTIDNNGAIPNPNGVLNTLTSLSMANDGALWTYAGPFRGYYSELDLQDNNLVIRAPATTGTTVWNSDILPAIVAGFNFGAFGNKAITSSTAPGAGNTALAAILNDDGFSNPFFFDGSDIGATSGQTEFTSLGAMTIDDIIIKYTYYGDLNLDGIVDGFDQALMDIFFGASLGGWLEGDINYDGGTDGLDQALLDIFFGAGSGGAFGDPLGGDGSAAIPEPGSLTLLAVGGLGLLRRRRR